MMNTKLTLKEWNDEDKPREKLLSKGKFSLSTSELLAILLRTGRVSLTAVDLAKQLMQSADSSLNNMARFGVSDFKKFKGIGEAKALTLIAALELGRRRKEEDSGDRKQVAQAKHAYEVIRPHLMDLPHEEFWVLLLNRSHHLLKVCRISTGGISGTIADPKLVFKAALDAQASALILVHNHPSGNLRPSRQDIQLTKKMKQAGQFLELPILDHLIYTNDGYYSFADEGML